MCLPQISVIIPLFNGSRFLAEAIVSIQNQTHIPSEIIVVDDCSTDGSLLLAKELSEASAVPITVYSLPVNSGGPSKPINFGVMKSNAEFILVLDQDDVLAEQAIEDLVAGLRAAPNALCAFHLCGMYEYRDEHRTFRSRETIADIEAAIPKEGGLRIAKEGSLLELLVRHGNFVIGYPGLAFRRSAFLRKGGVNESLKIAGDMELLGWLFRTGASVYVPKIGYYRREHEHNACRRVSTMIYEIGLVLSELCASSSIEVSDVVRSTAVAKIMSFAYWFRKANLFNLAIGLYRSLGSVGLSHLEICKLICKCNAERAWSIATGRRPIFSSYTSHDHAMHAREQLRQTSK